MIGRTFAVLACALLFAAGGARAQTVSTLHDFCGQTSCTDGAYPQGLVADAAGNLYGIASGGASDRGVVYELASNGSGGWTYSVIYSFCSRTRCSDGTGPSGPLIIDGAGNLYGVAEQGGKTGNGVAYELSPQGGGVWTFSVMRSFCKQVACLDGSTPSGGLAYLGQRNGALYDGTSPLYGTTTLGGAFGKGAVYMLTPPSGGKRTWWKSKVLYSFCPEGGNCLSDGNDPASGVVVDSSNVLYGTTLYGGQSSSGTLFKLVRGGYWTKQVLHAFCSAKRCADGGIPTALAESDAGNLYGGTNFGPHKPGCVKKYCGTIYEMTPGTGTFTTLYSFCSQADCADGRVPSGPVTVLGNGDLIGATSAGGDATNVFAGGGVLYRLSGTTLTVLHQFCGASGCSDGYFPSGSLVVDGLGRIFGAAEGGGANRRGTIFELAP